MWGAVSPVHPGSRVSSLCTIQGVSQENETDGGGRGHEESGSRRAAAMERATAARHNAYEKASHARESAVEMASHARHATADMASHARDATVERAGIARDATVEKATAIKDSATEKIRAVKPKFRGVSHEWTFFLCLGLGVSLLAIADTPRKLLAVGIYSICLCALFGTSALYHRVTWKTSKARMMMRRLDHSMIFLLIAGTVTPFCLLTIEGTWATATLIAVWTGAVIGIIIELIWTKSPKWVSVLIYLAVGWIGAITFPLIVGSAGIGAGLLIATGGILYTVGAVVYATQRPDPNPTYFGYHEVFHVFVIGAAGTHFAAIALFAL
jgi:hemolysin III